MIELNNGFKIISDGTQYQLIKKVTRTKKETNEEYIAENVEGYYSDLAQALSGYMRRVMVKRIEQEDMALKDVLQAIDELKMEIKAYDL